MIVPDGNALKNWQLYAYFTEHYDTNTSTNNIINSNSNTVSLLVMCWKK